MIAYKSLDRDGRSTYRKYLWPLPADGGPGEWVEAEGAPVLCSNGIHGWKSEDLARRSGARVFEMELDGDSQGDHQKFVAQRGRLLREISLELPTEPLERGVVPCAKCGKPHDAYQITSDGMRSWADRDDGHPYHSCHWPAYGRRLDDALRLIAEGAVDPAAIARAALNPGANWVGS